MLKHMVKDLKMFIHFDIYTTEGLGVLLLIE